MKVVFTNGCFDILHVGHLRLLRWARARGDTLTVGLNSDDSVHRLKGHRPFVPELERREMLLSLAPVDEVVIFPEDDPERLIGDLRPDVLVKGPDYRGEVVIGADLVTEVAIPDWDINHSTSGLVHKIKGRDKTKVDREWLVSHGAFDDSGDLVLSRYSGGCAVEIRFKADTLDPSKGLFSSWSLLPSTGGGRVWLPTHVDDIDRVRSVYRFQVVELCESLGVKV